MNLQVVSQVIAASVKEPILGLMLRLDMPIVRQILSQQEFALREESTEDCGMAVGVSSVEPLGACTWLMGLLDAPEDFHSSAASPARDHLPFAAQSAGKASACGGHSGRTEPSHGQGVVWLTTNCAKTLRVEELATMARMGVSTLHHQFRSLTAMSPLPCQKQLRLHVARERMLHDGMDAASRFRRVGYENTSRSTGNTVDSSASRRCAI